MFFFLGGVIFVWMKVFFCDVFLFGDDEIFFSWMMKLFFLRTFFDFFFCGMIFLGVSDGSPHSEEAC